MVMDVVVPNAGSGKPPLPPKRSRAWTEAIWLARLEDATGPQRCAASAIAAALPTMLVALGWTGTARALAALLPPADVALTLDHLETILSAIGFCSDRLRASGSPADTETLRAGSLALASDGKVGIYLGRPDGLDHWLVAGGYDPLFLSAGDTILSVEPDIDFQPIDEPRRRWFRELFEQMREALFKLFAMSFIVNLLALTVSLYSMVVYNVVIPGGTTSTIWGIALVATIATIGAWALRVGRQHMTAQVGSWAGSRIGAATMRKMLALPLEKSASLGILNNVVRMRSFESARTMLSGAGGLNLIDYPFVAIFLLVIAILGGWLVVVPIVALLVYVALAFPMSDYVSSKSTAAGVASSRLEEHATAAFVAINAFQRSGADSHWLARFADLARDAATRHRDYAIAVARVQTIGQALSMLTVLATLCVGIALVLEGTMNAGGLVAAMMLIWRITTPAQQAFGALVRLRQVRSSVDQLNRLMEMPAEHSGAEFSSPAGLANATIAADRIYYRPHPDFDAALNGVSFSAPAGTRVAIVGPNASGKTALLECLAGLRRPQSGRALIGGRDIRQFDSTEYRAWLGYVPQIVPALPLTVRDYLRLRVPTLEDDEAVAAFERVVGPDWRELPVFAGAADRVLDRELNPFTQDHAELQFRHLVAFVAATLRNPAVLLLDGDGVGGNPEWEKRILRYLDSIKGITTVIWAPSTTAHIHTCQQVVVLERGNVVQAGPAASPVVKA
ncbi:ATP-binding cassette domain-containing protein [Bradyrhizobium diazoefficiens]|nr:ATP-binding cassette domain-containing protein [Bradyrhizobium diazoefficiens]MBR0777910.1 ATP-binding cassette domain-containing protein [Bradyrhizobium diazoefficiens]